MILDLEFNSLQAFIDIVEASGHLNEAVIEASGHLNEAVVKALAHFTGPTVETLTHFIQAIVEPPAHLIEALILPPADRHEANEYRQSHLHKRQIEHIGDRRIHKSMLSQPPCA